MVIENLNELKRQRGLTNQQIADLSGVPLSTITRVFSGQTESPGFQTISDIVTALGGSLDEVGGLTEKREGDVTVSEKLIEVYESLIRRNERKIRVLFICLCVMVGVLLGIVVFDILSGNIGYIQY